MITEDYVSFETAKLLKEKGFDFGCDHEYDMETGELLRINPPSLIFNSPSLDVDYISAPTLQMAMKWLRETHWIDIEVRSYYLSHLKTNDIHYYTAKIFKGLGSSSLLLKIDKGSEDVIHTIYAKDTYEEVCETAIKYCLENLI